VFRWNDGFDAELSQLAHAKVINHLSSCKPQRWRHSIVWTFWHKLMSNMLSYLALFLGDSRKMDCLRRVELLCYSLAITLEHVPAARRTPMRALKSQTCIFIKLNYSTKSTIRLNRQTLGRKYRSFDSLTNICVISKHQPRPSAPILIDNWGIQVPVNLMLQNYEGNHLQLLIYLRSITLPVLHDFYSIPIQVSKYSNSAAV